MILLVRISDAPAQQAPAPNRTNNSEEDKKMPKREAWNRRAHSIKTESAGVSFCAAASFPDYAQCRD